MSASVVSGCRSIVWHEEIGLICAVRDSRSLADAMIRLIDQPADDTEAMGQAARHIVEEEFGENRVIDTYLAALRDIGAGSGVGIP
jgi:glycosyltransferase involved in cell wall biosynthesis